MVHTRQRSYGVWWATALAVFVSSSPIRTAAQLDTRSDPRPAIDAETRARARAEVDAAVAAFDAEEFQTALEHFRAAYELVPLQQLRFNIALCYERLTRLREAAAEYEALIDAVDLTEDARRRAREAFELLRGRSVTLQFSGAEGVVVRVDGDMSCEVPCELITDPGRHVVDGLTADRRTLELAEGQRLQLVAEAPPPVTNPAGSEGGYSAGPLFYLGIGTTLLGAGGIVGFGLRADEIHAAFLTVPNEENASEGSLFRDLSNGSIGIVGLGAGLMLLDVVLAVTSGAEPETEAQTRRSWPQRY